MRVPGVIPKRPTVTPFPQAFSAWLQEGRASLDDDEKRTAEIHEGGIGFLGKDLEAGAIPPRGKPTVENVAALLTEHMGFQELAAVATERRDRLVSKANLDGISLEEELQLRQAQAFLDDVARPEEVVRFYQATRDLAEEIEAAQAAAEGKPGEAPAVGPAPSFMRAVGESYVSAGIGLQQLGDMIFGETTAFGDRQVYSPSVVAGALGYTDINALDPIEQYHAIKARTWLRKDHPVLWETVRGGMKFKDDHKVMGFLADALAYAPLAMVEGALIPSMLTRTGGLSLAASVSGKRVAATAGLAAAEVFALTPGTIEERGKAAAFTLPLAAGLGYGAGRIELRLRTRAMASSYLKRFGRAVKTTPELRDLVNDRDGWRVLRAIGRGEISDVTVTEKIRRGASREEILSGLKAAARAAEATDKPFEQGIAARAAFSTRLEQKIVAREAAAGSWSAERGAAVADEMDLLGVGSPEAREALRDPSREGFAEAIARYVGAVSNDIGEKVKGQLRALKRKRPELVDADLEYLGERLFDMQLQLRSRGVAVGVDLDVMDEIVSTVAEAARRGHRVAGATDDLVRLAGRAKARIEFDAQRPLLYLAVDLATSARPGQLAARGVHEMAHAWLYLLQASDPERYARLAAELAEVWRASGAAVDVDEIATPERLSEIFAKTLEVDALTGARGARGSFLDSMIRRFGTDAASSLEKIFALRLRLFSPGVQVRDGAARTVPRLSPEMRQALAAYRNGDWRELALAMRADPARGHAAAATVQSAFDRGVSGLRTLGSRVFDGLADIDGLGILRDSSDVRSAVRASLRRHDWPRLVAALTSKRTVQTENGPVVVSDALRAAGSRADRLSQIWRPLASAVSRIGEAIGAPTWGIDERQLADAILAQGPDAKLEDALRTAIAAIIGVRRGVRSLHGVDDRAYARVRAALKFGRIDGAPAREVLRELGLGDLARRLDPPRSMTWREFLETYRPAELAGELDVASYAAAMSGEEGVAFTGRASRRFLLHGDQDTAAAIYGLADDPGAFDGRVKASSRRDSEPWIWTGQARQEYRPTPGEERLTQDALTELAAAANRVDPDGGWTPARISAALEALSRGTMDPEDFGAIAERLTRGWTIEHPVDELLESELAAWIRADDAWTKNRALRGGAISVDPLFNVTRRKALDLYDILDPAEIAADAAARARIAATTAPDADSALVRLKASERSADLAAGAASHAPEGTNAAEVLLAERTTTGNSRDLTRGFLAGLRSTYREVFLNRFEKVRSLDAEVSDQFNKLLSVDTLARLISERSVDRVMALAKTDAERSLFERLLHHEKAKLAVARGEASDGMKLLLMSPVEEAAARENQTVRRMLESWKTNVQAELESVLLQIDPNAADGFLRTESGAFIPSMRYNPKIHGEGVKHVAAPGEGARRSDPSRHSVLQSTSLKRFKGTGEAYVTDLKTIVKWRLNRDMHVAEQQRLLRMLEQKGLAKPAVRGVDPPSDDLLPEGQFWRRIRTKDMPSWVRLGDEAEGTFRTVRVLHEEFWVPNHVADAWKYVMEQGWRDLDFGRTASGKKNLIAQFADFTTAAMLATFAEASRHSLRVLAMLARLPSPSGDIGDMAARYLAPYIGTRGKRLFEMMNAYNSPDAPLIERWMARVGGLQERAFDEAAHAYDLAGTAVGKGLEKVGISPAAAGKAAAKAQDWLHRGRGFLFDLPEADAKGWRAGPFSVPVPAALWGFDVRARLVATRIFLEHLRVSGRLSDDVTLETLAQGGVTQFDEELREFLTQFGMFNGRTQTKVVQAIKRSRLNPFAGAQAGFRPAEIEGLLGYTRLKGGDAALRARYTAEAIAGGWLGYVAALTIANKAMSGHYPWENQEGHEFDLELPWKDPDGAPAYISAALLEPASSRAMRTTGLRYIFDERQGLRVGERLATAFVQKFPQEIISFVAAGPPVQAASVALTGRAPYLSGGEFLRVARPRMDARAQILENIKAALINLNGNFHAVFADSLATGRHFENPWLKWSFDAAHILLGKIGSPGSSPLLERGKLAANYGRRRAEVVSFYAQRFMATRDPQKRQSYFREMLAEFEDPVMRAEAARQFWSQIKGAPGSAARRAADAERLRRNEK